MPFVLEGLAMLAMLAVCIAVLAMMLIYVAKKK
jgi:hypothetical protein